MLLTSPAAPAPTLRRELGRWDLTAIGVNQVNTLPSASSRR